MQASTLVHYIRWFSIATGGTCTLQVQHVSEKYSAFSMPNKTGRIMKRRHSNDTLSGFSPDFIQLYKEKSIDNLLLR